MTLWKYLEADVMGILKFIFKIPMTSLQEYSKYQCHYEYLKFICHILHDFFWIFKIPMTSLQEYSKIPMTSAFEYSKYQWRHFMNIQNEFEYSKADAMGILKNHEDVIGLLIIWVFMVNGNLMNRYFWISMNIQADVIGILNINN